jgi:hypothetical protein
MKEAGRFLLGKSGAGSASFYTKRYYPSTATTLMDRKGPGALAGRCKLRWNRMHGCLQAQMDDDLGEGRALMKRPANYLLIAAFALVVVGCKQASEGASTGAKGASGVTMVAVLNRIENGESITKSMETTEGVSLEQVEKKLNDLPWSDAQSLPHVGLAYESANGTDSMKIGRPDNTPSSTSMQALWKTMEGGTPVYRRSEVFDSKEKALKILTAYFKKDPLLKSAATWTQVQE